jgi:hypothetical protein
VLTHRFWSDVLNSDPAVLGQSISLGSIAATVVRVLEPSVPYPTETQIMANMVTSPRHLGATMNTDRKHRMTNLFGRLAPGATVETARAELTSVHASMLKEHPDAYSAQARIQLHVRTLLEQIAAPSRTILLVLMAAAAVVFVIACSNVANLILARSVRREGELAVRAALGASRRALRRTLLAESLVLWAAGAGLGLFLAGPLVSVAWRAAMRRAFRFAPSKPRWMPAYSGSAPRGGLVMSPTFLRRHRGSEPCDMETIVIPWRHLVLAASAGFALWLGTHVTRAQDLPRFRSGVELVQLDVVVLDSQRRPVTGLTPADFTILDLASGRYLLRVAVSSGSFSRHRQATFSIR